MPYTKVVNDVYEKMLTWSIGRGVRPSAILNYLIEEQSHVLDPAGFHVAFQWESVPESKLVRVAISRMSFHILKDLQQSCEGLPTHAIATLLVDEHIDALTHSPEAYPGLDSLPLKAPKGIKPYRPTVGVYRPVYLIAREQDHRIERSIRAYCLGILGAYDEPTYLSAANSTDFIAFQHHYAGHSYVPIMVPRDIDRVLSLLKETFRISKGPLVSYMLWRELESRALLKRQGVKLQTGRQMHSLWGDGVGHLTTMHESVLKGLQGDDA